MATLRLSGPLSRTILKIFLLWVDNGDTVSEMRPNPDQKYLQCWIDEDVHKTVKYISVLMRMKMSEVVSNAVRHYARMLSTDKTFSNQLLEVQYPGSTKAPENNRRKGQPGDVIPPLS